MRFLFHRLLCFLGIRNKFDYAPPGLGPEVPHPYSQADALQCCLYCGGGRLHAIHKPPFNERRAAEILAAEKERIKSRYDKAVEGWAETDVRPGVIFSGWGGPKPDAAVKTYIEREH